MPRRLEASVVKAVVLSGVGGLRVLRRELTSLTTPGLLVPAMAASASPLSQNLSVAWCASNAPSAFSKRAKTSQNGLATWARRSISRSTIRPRVGLWTRPTERKLEPKRRVARETARVRVAPQSRSMSWRAAPAWASGNESSSRLLKVRSISSLVRAE